MKFLKKNIFAPIRPGVKYLILKIDPTKGRGVCGLLPLLLPLSSGGELFEFTILHGAEKAQSEQQQLQIEKSKYETHYYYRDEKEILKIAPRFKRPSSIFFKFSLKHLVDSSSI